MARPDYTAYLEEFEEPSIIVDYRPGHWVTETKLPSQSSRSQIFYFNNSNGLTIDRPPARSPSPTRSMKGKFDQNIGHFQDNEPIAYISSPMATGLDCGRLGYGQDPDFPVDQRNVDANSLCFDTLPLAEPIPILGSPEVNLFLSCLDPLCQVHIRLCDVCPRTGQSVLVTSGMLNLTHSPTHEKSLHQSDLFEQGKIVPIQVTLGEIGHVFPAGNRIRLAISTSLWPLVWPSPRRTTLGVHLHGDDRELLANLVLPIRLTVQNNAATNSSTGNDSILPDTTSPPNTNAKFKPTQRQRSRSLSIDQNTMSAKDTKITLPPSFSRRPTTASPHPRSTLRPTQLGTRMLTTDYVTGSTVLTLTKDYGHFRDEHCGIERGDWTAEIFGVLDPKHRWGSPGTLGVTAWMEVRYGIEVARSAEWVTKLKKEGRYQQVNIKEFGSNISEESSSQSSTTASGSTQTTSLPDETSVVEIFTENFPKTEDEGWRIVVESKTLVQCTETAFLIETELRGWCYASYDGKRKEEDDPLKEKYFSADCEGKEPLRRLAFFKKWKESIKRDLL